MRPIKALLIVVCLVGLPWNANAEVRAELSEVYNNLMLVKETFKDLGLYLPLNYVGTSKRSALQDRYASASDRLKAALGKLETEKPEVLREELAKIHYEFRWLGMLLPFYETEEKKQEDIIRRYLEAEDSLARAIRSLGLLVGGVVSTKEWKRAGKIWVGFGRMPLTRAQEDTCATLNARKIRGANNDWHIPSFDELSGIMIELKDPAVNTVFGEIARGWKEVWTSTENKTKPGFFDYINFELEKTGASRQTESYQVVCVATDNGAK